MNNHDQLLHEADELFDDLSPDQRERMAFRWSYAWNHEGGELIRRIGA